MKSKITHISIILFLFICLIGYELLFNNEKEKNEEVNKMINQDMYIKVSNRENDIIFLLNDSQAAQELYQQLPFQTDVENYAHNEKIFYLPTSLNTQQTPLLESGKIGTLAYFQSWGNIVMYYGECGPYQGLYHLGEAVDGQENIQKLSGHIKIEKVEK